MDIREVAGKTTRITTATTTDLTADRALVGMYIVTTTGTIEIQDGDGNTIVSDVAASAGWVPLPFYSPTGFQIVTSAADEVIVVSF